VFRSLIAALAFTLSATSVAASSDATFITESQSVFIAAQLPSGKFHVGTGVVIRAQGTLTIVTAAHVLKDCKDILVRTSDNAQLEVIGAPLIVPNHDLALLHTALPEGGLHVATPDNAVAENALLHVWGHPHSDAHLVLSPARFVTDRVTGGSEGLFAITCPTCAVGDSGGGVFDEHGHLLGIVAMSNADVGAIKGVVIAEPIEPALTAAGMALAPNAVTPNQ
jgi:S1-C subfamily serine protease